MSLNPEQLAAWHQFKWFLWLHEADPDCPLAKQALDDVWQRNPDFQPREHLDLLSWIGPLPEAGPSAEEMLARQPADWLDDLLTFEPTDRDSHAYFVIERNLIEAAKRKSEWGIAMGVALAEVGEWNAYLWQALL